jgi:CelD/BcsL family acetyltransferase involved in cellulose biosynthesis
MHSQDHAAEPISADHNERRAGASASKPRSPHRPEPGEEAMTAVELAARPVPAAGAPRPAPGVREVTPGPATWTTRVVRATATFEALEPRWTHLLGECIEPSVFLSHDWLYAWWTAYRPAAELAIVLVEDRGELRGVAPLMIETRRRAGLSVRVLRFIGDGTGETDHMHFLVARAARDEVLPRLLDAIAALDWDVAEFNQMPEAAATTAALLAWIDARRLDRHVERVPCPVRHLPAAKDAVLAALPARLRTSIRSSRRKLQQRHVVEFGRHDRPEEVADALEAFFANHASRWQGKGQAGAFAHAARRGFYERVTPRLLARGWLRFFHMKLDGRPVAQQYCFALDGTVMLLQEGFDYAHAADNVGNVLRSLVFEHLVESGAACYDFLAGSSRHKQAWSDATVIDLRIACARRSWRGWLFHGMPCALARAKDRVRPWRDRWRAWRAGSSSPRSDAGSAHVD